jgi:hypothetical protein
MGNRPAWVGHLNMISGHREIDALIGCFATHLQLGVLRARLHSTNHELKALFTKHINNIVWKNLANLLDAPDHFPLCRVYFHESPESRYIPRLPFQCVLDTWRYM